MQFTEQSQRDFGLVRVSDSSRVVDYHVHSEFSFDGKSSIDQICRHAVEVGITDIGFCEHVEFDPGDTAFGFLDYEKYSVAIDEARSNYGNRLRIRKGLEIGYEEKREREIRDWLDVRKTDFLIGSIHYVNNIAHDSPQGWGSMRSSVLTQRYFSGVRKAVESGLFDIVGHFDLIREYVTPNQYKPSKLSKLVDQIFELMVSNGTYLEINSRRRTLDTVPSSDLIQRYLSLGGKRFSFGSDAHSNDDLGVGIVEAMILVKSLKPKGFQLVFE